MNDSAGRATITIRYIVEVSGPDDLTPLTASEIREAIEDVADMDSRVTVSGASEPKP